MTIDLTEFRRLAGLTDDRTLPEVKERPGTKMVFGKLQKLKKGIQKTLAKGDRQSAKMDKVGDKVADVAAKRGGRLGHVAAAAYHANVKGTRGAVKAVLNLAVGRKKAAAGHAKAAVGSLRKSLGHAGRAVSTG